MHADGAHCRESAGTVPVIYRYLRCVYVCVCVCVFSSNLFWTSSSLDVPPGVHRRKVTQDFSSTFLLRCVPVFYSREGFSRSFPSSTVKSNFVGHFFFFFLVKKNPSYRGFELKSQRVIRLRGHQLSSQGDRLKKKTNYKAQIQTKRR